MKKEQVYTLCEAVTDITYIAAKENFDMEDSRRKFAQFIEWAQEFQYLHRNVEFGVTFEPEYVDSIYYFAIFKINQWRNV